MINNYKKLDLERFANKLNQEFNSKEISYLVSLLEKRDVLLESRGCVAQGGYVVDTDKCPYCGKPL